MGEAPQAIKVSSADITIDVFEQPILVICHPIKGRRIKEMRMHWNENKAIQCAHQTDLELASDTY